MIFGREDQSMVLVTKRAEGRPV